jgi:predicted branched-subunit amino acid permease
LSASSTDVTTEHASPRGEFTAGVAAILPAVVAGVPFGLLLGALGSERGLTLGEIGLMSATVFGGSAQFVALNGWTIPPAAVAIGLATLIVNLRLVLMSASIRPRMARWPVWQRVMALLLLTDETWAFAEARAAKGRFGRAFYAGLTVPLYVAWLISTFTGAALGRLVQDPKVLGFDFAFIAIFVGLVVSFRHRPGFAVTALAAGATAALVHLGAPGAWSIAAGAVAGLTAAAVMHDAGKETRP